MQDDMELKLNNNELYTLTSDKYMIDKSLLVGLN